MATIYIIDAESGETVGVYENIAPEDYNLEQKTITFRSGRGVSNIALGDGQIMRVEEDEPGKDDT